MGFGWISIYPKWRREALSIKSHLHNDWTSRERESWKTKQNKRNKYRVKTKKKKKNKKIGVSGNSIFIMMVIVFFFFLDKTRKSDDCVISFIFFSLSWLFFNSFPSRPLFVLLLFPSSLFSLIFSFFFYFISYLFFFFFKFSVLGFGLAVES